MLSQYLGPATALEWQKKLAGLESALEAAADFFGNGWKTESAWQWLSYLRDEMARFDFNQEIRDKESAFFTAVLGQVNWPAITDLADKIGKIVNMLDGSPKEVAGQVADIEIWKELAESLELGVSGKELIISKVFSLSEPLQSNFEDLLGDLAETYEDFKVQFRLLSAALLYYSPPATATILADLEKNPDVPVADWAPVLRVLGQAIHNRDGEALAWAGKFLYVNARRIEKNVFENESDHILFVVLLHLSVGNFNELNEWRQARAVEWYVWWALCFGVLVDKELREYLSGRPTLPNYIINSGSFSEFLRYSAQIIYVGDDKIGVGEFIKGFLSFAKGDGRESAEQEAYITKAIAERNWPTDLKPYLQKLLYIYIHLRDCDLVDYHGMLAEEQILLNKYDWKKIIRQDIFNKDIEDFKEHIKLIDRPALTKAELITAFESVPWEQEPFASRVARLSDMYSEVFPSLDYSPIMYFDEEAGKIKFNKKLPNTWYSPRFRFGIDEAVWQEAEAEAKKKFQNLSANADLEFEV